MKHHETLIDPLLLVQIRLVSLFVNIYRYKNVVNYSDNEQRTHYLHVSY